MDVKYDSLVTAAGMNRVSSTPMYDALYHPTILLVPPYSPHHIISGSFALRSLRGQNIPTGFMEMNRTAGYSSSMEIGSCAVSSLVGHWRDFLGQNRRRYGYVPFILWVLPRSYSRLLRRRPLLRSWPAAISLSWQSSWNWTSMVGI